MRARIAGFSLAAATLAFPLLASAQTLVDTLLFMSNILNGVIGLFITLAIVTFFWGLIKYLFNQDAENAQEGIKIMFWGVVAIFVMVSIWGIIGLVQRSLRVTDTKAIIPGGVEYTPRR